MASTPLEVLRAALAGRYTIDREIGRGGMATILLAHDVKHGRAVALKLLRPELAAQLGTDRFLREIGIAARLAHPNILPLLDSGTVRLEGGVEAPYYVMPLVEGESLRDRLTHGPLPAEEAIRLVVEVADALDCAHRQGIVHRDIKPDNVLLQQGHAVVSDFGIARAISAATGVARLTETGMSLGTRGYMSPEQLAGLEVDQRSDIYSLGCLVVEMLTGRPPVLGESSLGRVEPATLRGPIAKALALLPADRWNTAGEFASALRRARSTPRRVSVGLVLAMVAILAVAVVGVAVLGRGRRAAGRQDPGTDSTVARAMSLIADRDAPNVNEGLHLLGTVLQRDSTNARALAGVAMAYANASRWAMPIQGVPRDSLGPFAIRLSERALSVDSLDSGVWLGRAVIFGFLDPGRKAGVLAAYRRSLTLDSTNAQTWASYGSALHDLGRPDEGLEAYRTAFRLDPRRQNYWVPLHFLWARDLDSATKWADSAVSLTPDRYWTRNAAGYVALLAGDLATAEIHFTAAHLGESGNQRGGAAGLALVAALRGDRGYARKLLEEAIRVTDHEHPDVHNPIYIAAALDALRDRADALAWLERYQPVADLHYQLHLKFEPSLDPLRQEPRFLRLLRPLPR